MCFQPWMYNIPDKEIEVYRNKYKQLNYSSECLEVFEKSVLANKNVIKTRMINNLSKYREIAKTCTMLAGKKVYIYGAGEVGHYILNIIEDVIDFKGFVVSEDQDHDEGVYDLTSLEKIIEDDAIVYVAVSPDKMDIIKINIDYFSTML